MTAMKPVPNCPACGGRWLNGWRWQHDATACAIRAAEDATQAADKERVALVGPTFPRPTTPAEAHLWETVTGTALKPARRTTTVHMNFASGVWGRTINGHASAATAA